MKTRLAGYILGFLTCPCQLSVNGSEVDIVGIIPTFEVLRNAPTTKKLSFSKHVFPKTARFSPTGTIDQNKL